MGIQRRLFNQRGLYGYLSATTKGKLENIGLEQSTIPRDRFYCWLMALGKLKINDRLYSIGVTALLQTTYALCVPKQRKASNTSILNASSARGV